MERIKTIATRDLTKSVVTGGCGECQTSCQSACKTSCGVFSLNFGTGDPAEDITFSSIANYKKAFSYNSGFTRFIYFSISKLMPASGTMAAG